MGFLLWFSVRKYEDQYCYVFFIPSHYWYTGFFIEWRWNLFGQNDSKGGKNFQMLYIWRKCTHLIWGETEWLKPQLDDGIETEIEQKFCQRFFWKKNTSGLVSSPGDTPVLNAYRAGDVTLMSSTERFLHLIFSVSKTIIMLSITVRLKLCLLIRKIANQLFH